MGFFKDKMFKSFYKVKKKVIKILKGAKLTHFQETKNHNAQPQKNGEEEEEEKQHASEKQSKSDKPSISPEQLEENKDDDQPVDPNKVDSNLFDLTDEQDKVEQDKFYS